MNPAQLTTFAHSAARQRARLFGVRARWFGEELQLPISGLDPEFDLESGVGREQHTIRIRFPLSVRRPQRGDEIELIETGARYLITSDVPPLLAPGIAEIIVEASRG